MGESQQSFHLTPGGALTGTLAGAGDKSSLKSALSFQLISRCDFSGIRGSGGVNSTIVLPTAVTAMLLWRGRVSDIEITTRSERVWPLLLTTICLVTAGVLAWSNDAPPAVVGLAVILGLQAFATLLVSLSWKISVHCLSATTIGGLVWCLWGEPLPLLFIAPAMIWSRLYLKRHTPPQTIAGSVFGVASILTLWPVLVG